MPTLPFTHPDMRTGREASNESSRAAAYVDPCIQKPFFAARLSTTLRAAVKNLVSQCNTLDIVVHNDGVTPGNVLGYIMRKFIGRS